MTPVGSITLEELVEKQERLNTMELTKDNVFYWLFHEINLISCLFSHPQLRLGEKSEKANSEDVTDISHNAVLLDPVLKAYKGLSRVVNFVIENYDFNLTKMGKQDFFNREDELKLLEGELAKVAVEQQKATDLIYKQAWDDVKKRYQILLGKLEK